MLYAKDIYKSYGDLQVLKGVDIEINKGELLSITGKSGAGKTTLLHILGTLDRPDRGSVVYEGRDITTMSHREILELRQSRIGFIFQFHHLLPEFTALENVCLPAFIKKTEKKKAIKEAEDLLAYLGMKDRQEHKPGQLSGGEQQRVAVARALINTPDVIFADEPSGNLDEHTSGELHDWIYKLSRDKGYTFVIVTHNKDLAAMCDRNMQIVEGKIGSYGNS
jgi:lipoprotein-releasing system ATP-binding protein